MSEALEALRAWRHDPVKFVREAFRVEPDEWQVDALQRYMRSSRLAMKACKGPGKSAVLAWIGWHLLATRVDAKGIALSITQDNLKDNLWTELAGWQNRSDLLRAAFTWQAQRIFNNEHPQTWWLSARAFAQSADATAQSNTLAGLHPTPGSLDQTVFALLDEVSDYPQGVLDAAEGIFATKGVHARLVAAGNPTSVDGCLYRICTTDADKWDVVTITGDPDDPKRSPRIDLKWAREEIAKRGREDPVVMVNILGLFPSKGYDKLIHPDWVSGAMARDVHPRIFQTDPIVWGLDCARFGDDKSALARRQGVLTRRLNTWSNADGPQLASAVVEMIEEERKLQRGPDAIFVDAAGVGASAYDSLCLLGYKGITIPIDFAQRATSKRWHNKRSEMWDKMKDWLRNPSACLPTDGELVKQLTGLSMGYRTLNKHTALLLQSKEDLRREGKPSPDKADALALTFADKVESRALNRGAGRSGKFAQTEYPLFQEQRR